MSDILISREELDFLLWDWLDVDSILSANAGAGHDRETVSAFLDLSISLAADSFLPLYKQADVVEPFMDEEGNVRILPGLVACLRQYAELGLCGAGFPQELGGLAFPTVVTAASMAEFMAANIAASAYPMLTAGNARVIARFGSRAQVDSYVRPQLEGRTFGTMCLSEPQAGSSLGDIKTRAVRDGTSEFGPQYRLTGNKMWISGGDQDVTDNIVHLVLAKVPDPDGSLPEGTKGTSLFIVPKRLPDGKRNDVVVAGLNHKMGYRGTANCLLNFGEGRHAPHGEAGAIGYLLGEEGRGLALMFQMMNEARIQVGLGAAALAYRGYRQSVIYAQQRLQGRRSGPGADQASLVPIIRHPDVANMLLAQKSYAEGALSLVLYCASLVDREKDSELRELLALLTPVAKTWPSEFGLAANDLAIQIHGGYGYTRDFDVEQLYRDNRLNPIHEGTTGIQALDLLGRKIMRGDDSGLKALSSRISRTVHSAKKHRALALWAVQLEEAFQRLRAAIAKLRQSPNGLALANATSFIRGFGHIVVAWLWLDKALVSTRLVAEQGERPFHAGKLRACRYFFEYELPKALLWLSIAASLNDVAVDVPEEEF